MNLRDQFRSKLHRVLASLETPGISDVAATAFEPLEVEGLRAQCHTTWPDAALTAQWEALADRVSGTTPFGRSTWRGGVASSPLRIFTVHRSDQLLALLPMRFDDGAVFTPGAPVSDDLDPLINPSFAAPAWRAVLALMVKLWDRRTREFVLHNVRAASPCRMVLPEVAAAMGLNCHEDVIERAPYLRLTDTWESLLEGIDAHERREFRRRLRKAEAQGGANLTTCVNPSDIEPMLHTAMNILEMGHSEKSVAVRDVLRPLLLTVGPRLIADKQLQVKLLHIENQPAACLLQFAGADGPMLYNCGFDPAFKSWSPGSVAVCMSIRHAIEQDHARVFDFLRGRESYKYRLGAVDRALYRIILRK